MVWEALVSSRGHAGVERSMVARWNQLSSNVYDTYVKTGS